MGSCQGKVDIFDQEIEFNVDDKNLYLLHKNRTTDKKTVLTHQSKHVIDRLVSERLRQLAEDETMPELQKPVAGIHVLPTAREKEDLSSV